MAAGHLDVAQGAHPEVDIDPDGRRARSRPPPRSAAGTQAAPRRRRQSSSAGLPVRALLTDQIGGGSTEQNGRARLDPIEHLLGERFLGAVALGWWHVTQLQNEWLLPAITTLVAAAAVVAGGRSIRSFGAIALVAVAVTGGAFAWGVASHLDVEVVWTPRPMQAAAAKSELMFDASESGEYEVRVGAGGCLRGRPIATGVYGPGWEETNEAPATGRVRLGDTGLDEGPNDLFVCLRHGVASGEARTVLVVDDTPPLPPTLDVQPTTGVSGDRTARTRTLSFTGTAGEGRPTLEMNGLPLHDLPLVDGHWSFGWTLSPITDQAAFAVVVEDEAGNTSRSPMIHVDFVGIDPRADRASPVSRPLGRVPR